ncbi:MAG TPA: hypothetical protein DDZ80_02250 [Cyanobacteria bacterium UBA8803]|nr:hypothetical protein [Cyanobacteria bacterium UBA9273]HBL57406.1 hypothetical protein [Cyanobacteria bacterium UBA8803]
MINTIELPCDREGLTQQDRHKLWCSRGEFLASLGNYAESLVSFDWALAIQPEDYMTWLKRGGVLTHLARYTEALVSFERSTTIQPNDQTALLCQGMVLHHLGRYQQAYRCYEQVLNNQEPSSFSRLIQILKKWVYLPKLRK